MHHSLQGVLENAAYIAIGADKAYEQGMGALGQGHIEYIDQCTQHAELLEQLFDEFHDKHGDCPGVYAYEVCEPFGIEYGGALLLGKKPDANAIARRLVDELFKQGVSNVTRT